MGLFDSLKDFAGSAKSAFDEQKQRIEEKEKAAQNAGTLKPGANAASQPKATPAPKTAAAAAPAIYNSKSGVVTRKWGTISSIRYNDYYNGIEMPVKANGVVEFQITDPEKEIGEQMFLAKLLDSLYPIFDEISKENVPYDQLPAMREKISSEIKELFAKENIEILRFYVNSITSLVEKQKPLDLDKPGIAGRYAQAQERKNGGVVTGKYCPSCGAPDEGGKFCSNCGALMNR